MVLRALKSSAGFSRNMLKDKWSTPGSELMQTLRRGLFLKCTLYLSQQCINSLLSFKFQGRKKKKKSSNKVKVFHCGHIVLQANVSIAFWTIPFICFHCMYSFKLI